MSAPEKPLKIAHIVRRFAFEEWGGTESVVWNTVLEQRRKGITPVIFATSALSRPGEEVREGVRICRFPYFYPYFPMNKTCSLLLDKKGGNPFVPALFAALREENCDLVHIHCGGRMAVMSALVSHDLERPCVVSLHGGHAAVPQEELRQMMEPVRHKFHYGGIIDRLRHLRRDVVAEADAAICVSLQERNILSERYPGKKIVYLPNGVDLEKFRGGRDRSPRKKWNIPAERTLALCVSRIDYQKNQLLLLELLRHDPNCHVLLVGPVTAPWYHEKILEEAAKYGVKDRLSIIPGLSSDDPDLPAIFHEADFFVLPSLHEPFGIVALEAWAAGLPVLAARTGGLKDFIVDGRNGLLFDPEKKATLTACYDRLVGSPSLASSLAENASCDVEAYSWESVTGRLLDLYGTLCREKGQFRS